jgi:hypothetical protein
LGVGVVRTSSPLHRLPGTGLNRCLHEVWWCRVSLPVVVTSILAGSRCREMEVRTKLGDGQMVRRATCFDMLRSFYFQPNHPLLLPQFSFKGSLPPPAAEARDRSVVSKLRSGTALPAWIHMPRQVLIAPVSTPPGFSFGLIVVLILNNGSMWWRVSRAYWNRPCTHGAHHA